MNAGSTMTSRDSQEVRHIATARQARSGWPRWKNEAASPQTSSRSETPQERSTNCFGGDLNASSKKTIRNNPWAAPISVVSRITDHAGFKSAASCLGFGLAPRQVMVGGPGFPFRNQRVAAALADRLRHLGLRVVHVAEQARVGRAGHHAGGL